MKYKAVISIMIVAVFTFTLAGCGSTSTESTSSNMPPIDESHSNHDHVDNVQHNGSGQTKMEKMKIELAKLSPEDTVSAENQHICPVTDMMLGSMGVPKKIDVNGQQVWICCNGCRDKLLDSPDEYLAKLNKE